MEYEVYDVEEDLYEGGWEGEYIVFALLSLTLDRRAGEVPGSGTRWDSTE